MNPLYLETFRRHRILFLLPVVSAVAVAMWFNVGEPSMYRSTTSVWVDTPGGPATDLTGGTPPAAQEQSLLSELLKTERFRNSVARGGGLATYLERHPSQGWGPTALLSKLRGPGALDERIASALSAKRVTSLVQGPHVLELRYEAPEPTLAARTLRALLEEFRRQRVILRRSALTAYRNEVAQASRELSEARRNLASYRREHPGSTGTDAQLSALSEAERKAVARVAQASDTLTAVSSTVLNPMSFRTTFRVVDPPDLPTGPSAGPKQLVFAFGAGLFAGVLVSILGVALARTGRSARPVEERLLHDDVYAPEGGRAVVQDERVLADAFAERRTRSR